MLRRNLLTPIHLRKLRRIFKEAKVDVDTRVFKKEVTSRGSKQAALRQFSYWLKKIKGRA